MKISSPVIIDAIQIHFTEREGSVLECRTLLRILD